MSNRVETFLRKWMLAIAMTLGVAIYLLVYFVPALKGLEKGYSAVAKEGQPLLVGFMLFLQFNVTAPSDLKLHRWHARLLMVQALLFTVTAFICTAMPRGDGRLLVECAMLCFICPTAAACGVITSKIGGSLQQTMAYLLLSDLLATLLLPVIIPFVHPSSDITYMQRLWMIGKRVFSILVLPCALAWIIRYTLPGVQKWLARVTNYAFYIWGVSLVFALSLATKSLIITHTALWVASLIGLVSLICCLLQFITGRRVARRYGKAEEITSGQTLGQKNTGFLIWLGLNFMTPVTSVAGGLYAIWQNIVNSWELQHYRPEE